MHVIRPVQDTDLAQLTELGELSGMAAGRAHRMPVGRASLEQAVAASLDAFAAAVSEPGAQTYLFVLARLDDGTIDGCASLQAQAGAGSACFAFRRHVLRQISADLEMAHEMRALTMCSELSSYSHLVGRYLRPGMDAQAAAMLARAPLLYAAAAPQRFASNFIASFPGLPDSPFWHAVGRNFFERSLEDVETLFGGARCHPAVVEMMPHFPIYLDLMPIAAQAAVGQADAASRPFLRALMAEGFQGGGYAGLFDGGAVLHAASADLSCFARKTDTRLALARDGDDDVAHQMITAPHEAGFRVVLGGPSGQVSASALNALGLAPGHYAACVPL